jgi:hypothetical protein
MNLHSVVAGVIGAINPHEEVTVYTNTGTTNVKGKITPTYEKSTRRAQVQGISESDLKLTARLAESEHRLKFWLDAPVTTINRVTQSAGDIIGRADGTYWLIVACADDFAPVGWQSVLCVLQVDPPAGLPDDTPAEPTQEGGAVNDTE